MGLHGLKLFRVSGFQAAAINNTVNKQIDGHDSTSWFRVVVSLASKSSRNSRSIDNSSESPILGK